MPRAKKDKPPKRCADYVKCGNVLPDARATWCPECGKERRKKQKKITNAEQYAALRDPGSTLLDADRTETLTRCLGHLATAWNRYADAEDDPDREPGARDALHATLDKVLAELWAELPTRLTHGQEP